ncbi:MAG TPA: hypothetical protein PLZ79_08985 [Burkholderiales bacterium]|nr:hypothetical protein [Burkholderiaceae bacterium]HQR53394.1 hypothetical protein [Burkholderiales bacterium]
MLQSNDQRRFTPAEIEQARKLGIDLAGVKTKADYSNAVIDMITRLEHERPDLLEKIAKALAEKTGRKLPAKLRLVP